MHASLIRCAGYKLVLLITFLTIQVGDSIASRRRKGIEQCPDEQASI